MAFNRGYNASNMRDVMFPVLQQMTAIRYVRAYVVPGTWYTIPGPEYCVRVLLYGLLLFRHASQRIPDTWYSITAVRCL